MVKGQRVVCINDTFPAAIKLLYKQLPVKDITYTIREVYLGRELGKDATVGLLLQEITNPVDPTHLGKSELGFNAERFAPLLEETDLIEEEIEDLLTV